MFFVVFSLALFATSSEAFNALLHRSDQQSKHLHRFSNFPCPESFVGRIIMHSSNTDLGDASSGVVITDLLRYAIKGFSGDSLESVVIPNGGVQTFPDDRRYALLKETNREKFDAANPTWLHKENFLCAFSAPELMASFESHYEIRHGGSCTDEASDEDGIQRLLTLYRRNEPVAATGSRKPVLGPIDLNRETGRRDLASFFSKESNEALVCVTKEADKKIHTFQFGNTRAGVKNNPGGDTRTVHIVNKATVREFSDKIGLPLNPNRFRPNIVIDGLDPWEEFSWVGKTLRVVPSRDNRDEENFEETGELIMKVLTRTVRCEGVGIDPLDSSSGKLDVPHLLNKNYPEHGPYLGVYASIEVRDTVARDDSDDEGKLLSVGDTLEII